MDIARIRFWKRRPAPEASGRVRQDVRGPRTGSQPAAPQRATKLIDAYSEPLLLAHSLLIGQDLGEPVEARTRILRMLDDAEKRAAAAGIGTALVTGARFPTVAFIDEAVLNSKWSGKGIWRGNPLQLEFFKINTAGQEFFTRLEGLRQEREENLQLIELYYACLAMGFEGKYKVLGREPLEALLRELASDLSEGRSRLEAISPSWQRPDDTPEVAGEGIPVWLSVGGFLAALLLIVALFALGSRISADREAGTIREYYIDVVSAGEDTR